MAQHPLPERLARFFEDNGLPRMAGRVLGHLLVCVPPEQTFDEIVDGVGASRSTVSVVTRLLIQLGLIERVSSKTDRRDRYQLSEGAWTSMLEQDIQAARSLKAMAEEGLAGLKGQPAAVRSRLVEMRRFYTFLDEQYTPLMRRWRNAQRRKP